jgi:hypothetical protein
MQIFSPEEAILWVDQNVKQIQGHTRKYLAFAPYDQEDFLQDAYEAALEAVNVSVDRQIPFPACFWVVFKGKVSDVTPNPKSKRNAGSFSPPSNYCDWTDFSRDDFNQARIEENDESLSSIDIDEVYHLIRHCLTPAEKRVVELLLGIHEGPMKIREAARHLDCSPANIRQALNRACSRLSALIEQGELNLHLVGGEMIKQQVHQDDSISQPSDCPMQVDKALPSEDMEKVLKTRRDSPVPQNDSEQQKESSTEPHSKRNRHTHTERKKRIFVQSWRPSYAPDPLYSHNVLNSRHSCEFQPHVKSHIALECEAGILKEMISSIPHGAVSFDLSLRKNSQNVVRRALCEEAEEVTPVEKITRQVIRMSASSKTHAWEFYERSRAQSKDFDSRTIDFFTNIMPINRQISLSQCRDGPGPFWSDFSPGVCSHAISR